ncbi:hypothetical protein AB7M17_003099 [Bradyrhizobium sp. USDA 377]
MRAEAEGDASGGDDDRGKIREAGLVGDRFFAQSSREPNSPPDRLCPQGLWIYTAELECFDLGRAHMLQLQGMSESKLIELIGKPVSTNESVDDLGYQLALEASDSLGMGLSNLWEQAKNEFRILVCTDDARYASVRAEAAKLSPTQTAAFVSFLSAGLGAAIGVAATLLAPLVGLLLLSLLRLGTETFCRVNSAG